MGVNSYTGTKERHHQWCWLLLEKSSPIDTKRAAFSSSHKPLLLLVTFFFNKKHGRTFFPPYVNRGRSCAPQADRVEECPSPHQSAAAIASSYRSFPPRSCTVRRSCRPHQGNSVAQGINRRWEGGTRGHSSSTAASVSPTLWQHIETTDPWVEERDALQ